MRKFFLVWVFLLRRKEQPERSNDQNSNAQFRPTDASVLAPVKGQGSKSSKWLSSRFDLHVRYLTYCLGGAWGARNGSSFRILLQVARSCAVHVASWIVMLSDFVSFFITSNHVLFGLPLFLFPYNVNLSVSPDPFKRHAQSIGDVFAVFWLLYLWSSPAFLESSYSTEIILCIT